MLEKNQLSEDTEKERHENKVEISVGGSKLCGKDGERQTDSSKKSKEGSKRNAKEKHTVPQPFSFATDKRKDEVLWIFLLQMRKECQKKNGVQLISRPHNPNYPNLSV